MDDFDEVEIWRIGAEKMLRPATTERKRQAYLLAAAALREAGEDELADQVEVKGQTYPANKSRCYQPA